MAYTKQTWTCGETITADKLNHMEDGIAEGGSGGGTGSALIVTQTHTDCPLGEFGIGAFTLSETWQQIKDAYDAGLPIYLQYEEDEGFYKRESLSDIYTENSVYYVVFVNIYSASTASDYLTYSTCQGSGGAT